MRRLGRAVNVKTGLRDMSADILATVTGEAGSDTAAKPGRPNIGAMKKSILDPNFRYRPSHATDIRKTFGRVREELKRTAPEHSVVALKRPPSLRKEHS